MAEQEDVLFYMGYGFVVIVLGLMILLFSMGAVEGGMAFGLWLLCTSMIMIGLGSVRTKTAPSGSTTLIGSGLFFAVISMAILGIILQVVNPVSALAIIILLMGVAVVAFGIKRSS
jgi:hypothetical protein